MSPRSGCSRPAIKRSVVVFPHPLGPSKTTVSFFSISSVSPSTANGPPNALLMPSKRIAAMPGQPVQNKNQPLVRKLTAFAPVGDSHQPKIEQERISLPLTGVNVTNANSGGFESIDGGISRGGRWLPKKVQYLAADRGAVTSPREICQDCHRQSIS